MLHVARDWRTRRQRYTLAADVCEVCGAAVFPPRPVCVDCMPGARQIAGEAQARAARQAYREEQPVRVVVVAQEGSVPVAARPQAEGQAAEEAPGALAILKQRLDGEGEDGQILFSYE